MYKLHEIQKCSLYNIKRRMIHIILTENASDCSCFLIRLFNDSQILKKYGVMTNTNVVMLNILRRA